MPTLPSGLTIGIGHQAIPKSVGPDWFKCPEGHFWYKRPDISITPPPYDGTTTILEDWVHAPVPKSINEVKQYLYVLYRQPDGKFQWHGEWLNEFPRPEQLSKEDEEAWSAWIGGEQALPFLHNVIEICRRQAESNSKCSGVVTFCSEEMTPKNYYYGPFLDHFHQFWHSLDSNGSASRVRSKYNHSRFARQSDLHFSTFDLVAKPSDGLPDHLADIPTCSHIDFLCALFLLILIDQVMYSHRKSDYEAFQAITQYPKADRTIGFARTLMMANPYELFSIEILQSRGIEHSEVNRKFAVWASFIVQDLKSFFATNSVGGSTWDVIRAAMLSDANCFADGKLGAYLRHELDSEVR